MSRTLPLLLDRDVHEIDLVCGAIHLPRIRYFFGGVYPRFGIRCRYRVVREAPMPATLAWEAAAVTVMRRQRRAARLSSPRCRAPDGRDRAGDHDQPRGNLAAGQDVARSARPGP